MQQKSLFNRLFTFSKPLKSIFAHVKNACNLIYFELVEIFTVYNEAQLYIQGNQDVPDMGSEDEIEIAV